MIVMIESGRLGNQIFQYLALRGCSRSSERIHLLGFDQLKDVFNGVDASFTSIRRNPLRHLQSLDASALTRVTRALPSTGLIKEDSHGEVIIESRKRLMVATPSWFQSANVLNEPALCAMHVREHWLSRAHSAMKNHGLTPDSTAFVHARAGDYRTWPSTEHPAILDPPWYSSQAHELKMAHPGLRFVVIGDEPDYRSAVAAQIPESTELNLGFEAEFAMMTLCMAGILSASTYAFWGAYFAHRSGSPGPFIAPQHWAGHRSGTWYPTAIESSFLKYV